MIITILTPILTSSHRRALYKHRENFKARISRFNIWIFLCLMLRTTYLKIKGRSDHQSVDNSAF